MHKLHRRALLKWNKPLPTGYSCWHNTNDGEIWQDGSVGVIVCDGQFDIAKFRCCEVSRYRKYRKLVITLRKPRISGKKVGSVRKWTSASRVWTLLWIMISNIRCEFLTLSYEKRERGAKTTEKGQAMKKANRFADKKGTFTTLRIVISNSLIPMNNTVHSWVDVNIVINILIMIYILQITNTRVWSGST